MKSFPKNSGVVHLVNSELGYVVENNPDQFNRIQINFMTGNPVWIKVEDLDNWPTDANGIHIKVGDLVLFPIKGNDYTPAKISQGVVQKSGRVNGDGTPRKVTITEDGSCRGRCVNRTNSIVILCHLGAI